MVLRVCQPVIPVCKKKGAEAEMDGVFALVGLVALGASIIFIKDLFKALSHNEQDLKKKIISFAVSFGVFAICMFTFFMTHDKTEQPNVPEPVRTSKNEAENKSAPISKSQNPDNTDSSKAVESDSLIPSATPTPVEVLNISIENEIEELGIGENILLKTVIEPENATDKSVIWESSDSNVLTIDEKGNVKAINGGTATVTVIAANGKTAQKDIVVDGSKRTFILGCTSKREDSNNIGNEWIHEFKVNGEKAKLGGEYTLKVGDKVSLYAQYSELDDNPDIGEESKTHKVTEDDIKNGFEVSLQVTVKENGGRYKGRSAQYTVTFKFGTGKTR